MLYFNKNYIPLGKKLIKNTAVSVSESQILIVYITICPTLLLHSLPSSFSHHTHLFDVPSTHRISGLSTSCCVIWNTSSYNSLTFFKVLFKYNLYKVYLEHSFL